MKTEGGKSPGLDNSMETQRRVNELDTVTAHTPPPPQTKRNQQTGTTATQAKSCLKCQRIFSLKDDPRKFKVSLSVRLFSIKLC